MTRDEIKAYIEANGNAEAVVEEIRKMQDEGVEVTEQELTRRLKAVERSLGAMEKAFTKPDAPEFEKTPTKKLRELARGDIEWMPLMKLYGLCLIPLLGLSILATLFPLNTTITSISGAGTIIWAAFVNCGLIRSFLDIRRGEEPKSFMSEASHTPSMLLLLVLKGVMVVGPLIPGLLITFRKPAIGGALMIAGIILGIFLAITYSQAEFNLVEGNKAIQSLKFSRLAMKEDRARYFVMMIPLVLWALLAGLCAGLIGAIPTLGQAVQPMGISVVVTIASFVFSLPLGIYQLMCQTEFYDELRGFALTQKEPKDELKVFSITVVAGVLLLITALVIV